MLRLLPLLLIAAPVYADDSWKSKPVSQWTEAETRQVLTDSPWAAMVTPTIKKESRQAVNHNGGLGVGPVSIGGIGRRRSPAPLDPTENAAAEAQPCNVRWESALPIREAELRARETTAPAVDENHYAIAIYGLSNKYAKESADHLKNQAAIKREGQKDLKPSSVDVIPREDGVVVVFLFPRTKELTGTQAEFGAQIGPYQFTQSFHLDQMVYQGKMEL